jgi:hypothetical protein
MSEIKKVIAHSLYCAVKWTKKLSTFSALELASINQGKSNKSEHFTSKIDFHNISLLLGVNKCFIVFAARILK